MTLFNKFISFFALAGIVLLGALAIHSIKVDTIPLDRALGLIGRTSAPAFTLKAKAFGDAVYVTNCAGGACFGEATAQVLNATRQAVSQTIGGIIAMIKATVKSIMRIIAMIKKVFNFFISLIQKFSGQDLTLYSIIAAVREIEMMSNSFAGYYKGLQKEWDSIQKDYQGDLAKAQENIKGAIRSLSIADDYQNKCIAATLAEEQGLAPQGVDVDALCKASVRVSTAVTNRLKFNSASSGVASDIFAESIPSTTTTSNTTYTTTPVTSPISTLFALDPDTGRLSDLDASVELSLATEKARKLADNKLLQAKQQQAWAPDCGLYIGQDKVKLDTKTARLNSGIKNSELIKTATTGTLVATKNSAFSQAISRGIQFDPTQVDKFDIQALTPEKCSYAQNAANTTTEMLNQANNATQTSETAGGIQSVVGAIQTVIDLIQTVQQIFQTISGFITELIQIGKDFTSAFTSFFSGIGDIFSQAGAGGGAVLSATDSLKNSVGDIPLINAGANVGPKDDGKVTIDGASISGNQEKIAQYSDQSLDCILDNVKIKATGYVAEYKGDTSTINTDNLTVIGKNNLNTYLNGSNVPDSVMGASVTDANTPPMQGLTFKKADGSTGTISGLPSRALFSSGGATGNINPTYHVCQSSRWQDDNSPDTAGRRLASYPFDPKYGGPSPYRDGVSADWRVVNNQMNKNIPEECYLTNNNLSNDEKREIIRALGISITGFNNIFSEQQWQEAKNKVDDAQRKGQVRWDPDPSLSYQNRVRGGVIVGSGNDRKEVPIKPGKCEVSYSKDAVNSALQYTHAWSLAQPEIKSFVEFAK